MENYSTNNMKNININFETLSPINKRQNYAKNDLNNINNLYDKKNIMLQNKLFSLIIKFHSIFKKLIADINSVLITLGNQTISSKSLLSRSVSNAVCIFSADLKYLLSFLFIAKHS